jgi:hypothetical protein
MHRRLMAGSVTVFQISRPASDVQVCISERAMQTSAPSE